jgi:gephyrin
MKLDPERPEYHRSIVRWDDKSNCFSARSTGAQASSRLLSARSANALVIVPQGTGKVDAGTMLPTMIIGKL